VRDRRRDPSAIFVPFTSFMDDESGESIENRRHEIGIRLSQK